MRNIVLASILFAGFTLSPAAIADDAAFKSHCGPVSEEISTARQQLKPWLIETESRIKKLPGFERLVSSLSDTVICHFSVSPSGTIDTIKVVDAASTSASAPISKEVEQLVRSAAPFSPPPNSLPTQAQNGLRLELSKKDGDFRFSLMLGRKANSLPIQQFSNHS